MPLVPYTLAAKVVDDFHDLLIAQGISPPAGTKVEGEVFSMGQLLHEWKVLSLAVREPALLRDAAGAHDLAAKILSARDCDEFPQLLPHLKLLGSAPDYARITQLQKGHGRDDLSRKYVELYLACLAIHCSTNLLLDDPSKAKGDNPDIMLQFAERKLALAIKAPSPSSRPIKSISGQSIFNLMVSAAGQIERSSAETGLIVISLKNVLEHDKLWQGNFRNLNEAVAGMRAQVEAVCEAVAKDRTSAEWEKVFRRRGVVGPVVFLGQSLVQVPVGTGDIIPTPLKALFCEQFNHEMDTDAIELLESMNMFMASIVGSRITVEESDTTET